MFVKGLKVFIISSAGAGFWFVFQIFVAKILGPSEYGKVNIILGLASSLLVLGNLGFQIPIVKRVSEDVNNSPKFLMDLILGDSIVNIILIPLWFFIVSFFLSKSNMNAMYYSFSSVFLIFLFKYREILYFFLVGQEKQVFATFYKSILIRLLLVITFTILGSFYGFSHASLLNAMILSHLVTCYFFFKIVPSNLITKSRISSIAKLYFALIKKSWQYFIANISNSVYIHFSKVLQGMFSSFMNVGLLSLGITFGSIGVMIGSSFAILAMPSFSTAWNRKDYHSISKIYHSFTRWNSLLALPAMIFFILNVHRILVILGQEYVSGSWIVSMIVIAQFFNSFVGPNGTLLNMTEFQKYEIFNGFLTLVMSLLMGFTLGQKYSYGIALSLSVPIIVINLIKVIEVKLLFNIYPFNISSFTYIIFWGMCSAVPFYSASFIASDFVWALISLFLIISSTLLGFYFSPEKNDREKVRFLFCQTCFSEKKLF